MAEKIQTAVVDLTDDQLMQKVHFFVPRNERELLEAFRAVIASDRQLNARPVAPNWSDVNAQGVAKLGHDAEDLWLLTKSGRVFMGRYKWRQGIDPHRFVGEIGDVPAIGGPVSHFMPMIKPSPLQADGVAPVQSPPPGDEVTVDASLVEAAKRIFSRVRTFSGGETEIFAKPGELATFVHEAGFVQEVQASGHEDLQDYIPPVAPFGFTEQQVTLISQQFRKELASYLTIDQLGEIVARNQAEQDSRICHTHDFCDANVLMAAAFEEIIGHEIDLRSGPMCDLWGQAWNKAKEDLPAFFERCRSKERLAGER